MDCIRKFLIPLENHFTKISVDAIIEIVFYNVNLNQCMKSRARLGHGHPAKSVARALNPYLSPANRSSSTCRPPLTRL